MIRCNLKRRINTVLFFCAVLLSVYVILSSKSTQRINLLGSRVATFESDEKNINAKSVSFDSDWYYYIGKNKVYVSLPVDISGSAQGNITRLYHELPRNAESDTVIGFFTMNQYASVFINDGLIYEYKVNNTVSWISSFQWFLHIVSLKGAQAGDELCIQITAPFKNKIGRYKNVLYGSHLHVVISFLKKYGFMFALSLFFMLFGFLLIVVHFIFCVIVKKTAIVFYWGMAMLFASLWGAEESFCLQLFITNPAVHWCFEYLVFIFLPLLIFLFTNSIFEDKTRTTKILYFVNVFVPLILLVLQFTGIRQLTEWILLCHATMFIDCVYLIVKLLTTSTASKKFFIPSLTMFTVIVFETVYYILIGSCQVFFLTFGIFMFFVTMSVCVISLMQDKYKEAELAEAYRKLAYMDMGTGVYNHAAWYSFVEKYHCEENPSKYYLVMFDMNNLKKINDTYGHIEGDEAIKSFCTCLKNAFEGIGTFYRIGGDEFICLCRECTEENLKTSLVKFSQDLASKTKGGEEVSAAYGYAFVEPQNKDDWYTGQRLADRKMYEMKNGMKGRKF